MSLNRLLQCRLPLLLLPVLLAGSQGKLLGQAEVQHRLDLAGDADPAQYEFLSPILKDVEVVSLAESIHMTHEFPLVRIAMVQWMHEHLGFDMLAMEGSPEDLWVSQDAFLHDPANLAQSTSGVFFVWDTAEMRQLFAYEASTWQTSHPLYITAYDIQPGTGRASRGVHVFELLAQRLTQYAPPPAGFNQAAWSESLRPLTSACGQFKADDAQKIDDAIGLLQEWIDRAAPNVDAAFPSLPHAAALRLVPENLRASLSLCEGYASGGSSGAGLYKPTRDKHAAEFALHLEEVAPAHKLMLWAHVSHLFYDTEGNSTSVGEILHRSLGSRLYTIGAFAQSGGAVMLFSDWNYVIGYGRVWGVSGILKRKLGAGCPEVCFYDLRNVDAGSVLAQEQRVWFEAIPHRLALAKDFDGIVWVRTVHPPQMTFAELVADCTTGYWRDVAIILLTLSIFIATAMLIARSILRRRRRRAFINAQPRES
jgi:erythromycin esterase